MPSQLSVIAWYRKLEPEGRWIEGRGCTRRRRIWLGAVVVMVGGQGFKGEGDGGEGDCTERYVDVNYPLPV